MIAILVDEGLSVRRACQVASLARAAYYRPLQDQVDRDGEIVAALSALVAELPQWGFGLCFRHLRIAGHRWNQKRVLRVYRQLRLHLPRRAKKRVPTRVNQLVDAPAVLHQVLAMDFMSNQLYTGPRFRTMNLLDEGNREGLAVEVAWSFPAVRVVAILDQLVAVYGSPDAIRLDNGPEMVSEMLRAWAEQHRVRLLFIQPGKPTQNAYIERFNGTYRKEVLDAYIFGSLADVRFETEGWLPIYNLRRPHESLGGVPTLTYPPRSAVAA